jgi:CheY-like chemotaxis protein
MTASLAQRLLVDVPEVQGNAHVVQLASSARPRRTTSARMPQPGDEVRPLRRPRRSARGAGFILIVDDAADTRELYATYLDSRGFSALTAPDGEVALEMARRLRPDVIVMDLAMPRLDGIMATERLKRDPRTRRIPVILMTGYPHRAIQQGALEAGADVFLTKPCLPEDLESHLRALRTHD